MFGLIYLYYPLNYKATLLVLNLNGDKGPVSVEPTSVEPISGLNPSPT